MPGFSQIEASNCAHLNKGWCYVVASSAEHLKIGSCRTASPLALVRRLRTIQALCPTPLSLLRLFTGGRPREMSLHKQFAPHRLHGEWFSTEVLNELTFSGCPDCDMCILPFVVHPDDLRLLRGEP